VVGTKLPGEFELIARFFRPLAADTPGALGLGDDVALIGEMAGSEIVVTADALVAGVHFLADDPPDMIARKMLRVNLSDLAGKGAEPLGYVMTLALPGGTTAEWLARFTSGLAADQAEFRIGLLGGDTTQTPGPMALSVTALGRVEAGTAPLRRGARLGDEVWVSGTLGDGALGLRCLRGEFPGLDRAASSALIDRYRLPQPRVALGVALRKAGLLRAALDVSDGLVADLGHICEQSRCGAEIEFDRLPVSAAARIALGIEPARLEDVLAGGDDYELLFTAAPEAAGRIEALMRRHAVALTPIGRIIEGDRVRVRDAAGRVLPVGRSGYTHF
jgi:thiamine-monophosphate kinase